MRIRITVRGEHTHLRGYIDGEDIMVANDLAIAMKPFGVVLASPADDDYYPFRKEEQ